MRPRCILKCIQNLRIWRGAALHLNQVKQVSNAVACDDAENQNFEYTSVYTERASKTQFLKHVRYTLEIS